MKDGLRINRIHHNTQTVEIPICQGGGVAFFCRRRKICGRCRTGTFHHIVVDGQEQIVNRTGGGSNPRS